MRNRSDVFTIGDGSDDDHDKDNHVSDQAVETCGEQNTMMTKHKPNKRQRKRRRELVNMRARDTDKHFKVSHDQNDNLELQTCPTNVARGEG